MKNTKRYDKKNLPQKNCHTCHRPFYWRKKWEKVWDKVKYCSQYCRSQKPGHNLNVDGVVSEIIRMAWADEVPFEMIRSTYGMSEPAVIQLLGEQLKPSSFRLWRKRVRGRRTKHQKKNQKFRQRVINYDS